MVTYSYHPSGQLHTAADGSGTISNLYDRLGRKTEVSDQRSGVSTADSTISYDYDSLDNLTNSVLVLDNPATNNLTTAYSYDSAGRLNVIQSEGAGQTQTFSYASVSLENRLSAVTNEITGVVTSYEYDGFNHVTNISYTASDDSLIRSVAYEYDSAGMITNRVIDDGSQSTAVGYLYDNLGRLYKETAGAYTNEFLYDLAGNRTTVVNNSTTNSYTLGTGNRLTSWGTNGSAQYGGAGNTTNLVFDNGTAFALQWDERHRLTSASSATSAVEYVYDVFGRRISRTAGVSPAEVEHYVYSGSQIAADVDENGDLIRSYTYGPGVDNILSMTVYSGSTNTYYYLKDIQNSVIALTDENGDVVESYEYDAYGNTTVFDSSHQPINSSTVGNRYMWQGREYDSTAGLYYFRARWYNPETGRWLSKDPIGIDGGLNLYVFVGNNPVNYVDPFGLCCKYPDDYPWPYEFPGEPEELDGWKDVFKEILKVGWKNYSDPIVETFESQPTWLQGLEALGAAVGGGVYVYENGANGSYTFQDAVGNADITVEGSWGGANDSGNWSVNVQIEIEIR